MYRVGVNKINYFASYGDRDEEPLKHMQWNVLLFKFININLHISYCLCLSRSFNSSVEIEKYSVVPRMNWNKRHS